MTDLDARVAALMALADTYYTTNTLSGFDFNQAIRAELQKPALHELVTDAETDKALQMFNVVGGDNRTRIRRTLSHFLQGRAKPAQEEITDAERYQFAAKYFVLAGGGAFGWNIAPATKAEWDMYLDKEIRASKGEKT